MLVRNTLICRNFSNEVLCRMYSITTLVSYNNQMALMHRMLCKSISKHFEYLSITQKVDVTEKA